MMNRFICKCLLVCFLSAFQLLASNHEDLSPFEKEILQKSIEKHGLTIDINPENKKIRNFYFYTENPFKTSDKLVSWVNFLHFTTQDSALASQLWVHPGDIYNSNILIENEQALLNPLVRSFALIFPVQKTDNFSSTEVDLLVVTKDIFTWTGTSSISAAGAALGQLSLGFSQTNLFGYNKTLGGNLGLNSKLLSLSGYYLDPSLFSTKYQLTLLQGVYLNNQSFAYEGLNTTFQLSYPLATEDTPWGCTASFTYNNQPQYDFQGAGIRTYEGYDRQYRALQISPQLIGVRSFGKKNKQNLSFGYGANLFKYTALEAVPESFIQNVLPYSEFQSFAILGYSFFQNRFLALYDYNTFVMTEWAQLGPSFSLSNQIALNPVFGSDHTFYKPTVSLGASAAPTKDSLLKISSQLTTRFQDKFINNQISVSTTAVLPAISHIGRFVLSATYANIWNNQNNTFFSLGGEAGLRGVPYRYYQGSQFLRTNVEFRTRSMAFWIFRFGLASFYDFGVAFNNSSDFNPAHDLGLGLRILMVPWNRVLIRVDAATPVWGPIHGVNNTLITLGIGQAF